MSRKLKVSFVGQLEEISITEFRVCFGNKIKQAEFGKKFIIKRRGVPIVVLSRIAPDLESK